jgi:hypothetical protein
LSHILVKCVLVLGTHQFKVLKLGIDN